MKTVAVFGAGIAGLSVAHELSRRGYKVSVYEANSEAGGFFRSARVPQDEGMPSEYSWHGFGPWYHNVFDVMKQIPYDDTGSVYDKALSRPVNYGVAPDEGGALFEALKMFRMSWWDKSKWAWLLLKTWGANRRTFESYSQTNAAHAWRHLSELGWKTWSACFGPWVGSEWTKVSLHHVGQFFRKNLMSGSSHQHAADEQGPAWTHGAGSGWLLLRGPSSECWFDKWVEHLKSSGVEFFWDEALHKLEFDGNTITAASTESGRHVDADCYVLAANPFSVKDVLERTPELAALDQLRLFEPLIQDGPHTQVSFRIAFGERVSWPGPRKALVLADSEFNLTIFAQEQVWSDAVDLGPGIKSLWTGTACAGTVPGRLYKTPVVNCTKEQFMEEVVAQMLDCQGLNTLLRQANQGRELKDFQIMKCEVWHEWLFSSEGIAPRQPKWVTTTNTQPYLPTQTTPVSNLVLAGAHTQTSADLWSIEAAVESGRLAARVVDPGVGVLVQHKAWWLRAISVADDICFAVGAPHVLDIVLVGLVAVTFAALVGSVTYGS